MDIEARFPLESEVRIIKLPEGVKPTYGFVTKDREYAKYLIDSIKDQNKENGNEVIKQINNASNIEYILKDGTKLVWVQPNDSVRGRRFAKLWIDFVTCDLKILQSIILAKAIFADREDIKIVQSNNQKDFSLFELIEHLKKFACVYGDIKVKKNDSEFGEEDINSLSEYNGEIIIGY